MKKPLTQLNPSAGGKQHCCAGGPTPRPSLAGRPRERQLLEELAAGLGPDPAPVMELALGRRFLGVATGQGVGLASTLGAAPGPGEEEQARELKGAPLSRAAGLLLGESPWLASLGLAALNAAHAAPAEAGAQGAEELLLRLAPGKRVVVMGDFPFTQTLAAQAGTLHLLELKPEADTPPAGQWEDILASCQVAALTATALMTRSLAWALDTARDAVKVVVGPSTPWSPVLFSWGADVLAGSRVAAPGPVMEAVGQGLPFRQIKRRGVEARIWARPGLEL
ncbi:MAG: hypothetical protein K9K66_15695 [Desulfarculaceae bacterium]|nr:hypothetical protein [Desulfarculaceae bacterium]MCF8073576.1 hypothetical protein [Desulfarculaceae bacterium]MCF8103098.1 hypothetical protein [Desulfarculaceae bacterium]MCF8115708.1 hypothetical protein [Desulfarculaceae bacterium]